MIPNEGFCIHVRRIRQEQRAKLTYARTVSEYKCYWNGALVPELAGQLVERGGPGNNTYLIGNKFDRRIEAGVYPLAIHDSEKFKTIGYPVPGSPKTRPRPAIRLDDTGQREGILIHPGQDYVWSTGCLNPASELTNADSGIDYADSFNKVVDIIDFLAGKVTTTPAGKQKPPKAVAWVEGEPG